MIGLLVLTGLRWVVAGATELTPGEALVWLGGRQGGMGYLEHGPLAGWLARAGTSILGETSLGVRWWAPLAILGASILAWRLAASAFGEKASSWFLTVLQLTPMVNVASVRALPETCAFVLATAAAWWLWQALHRASGWAWQWSAAGAAMGLGFLVSPTSAAMAAGMVVLLVVPRRWRGRWRDAGPWVALGTAVAVGWPWLGWMRGLGWLPAEQAWLRWRLGIDGLALAGWLGQLVLAASPFLFAGMVWAVGRALGAAFTSWRRYRVGGLSDDDPWNQKNGRVFLLGLAGPGVLWAVTEAAAGRPALGAAAFGGCAALMLLAAAWVESSLVPTAHRLAQNAALLVAAAYSLMALHGDLARHLGLRWRYALDPGRNAIGWRELAAQTEAAVRSLNSGAAEPRPVFLIADSPELAAILEFYLPADLPLPSATSTRLRCHIPWQLAVHADHSFWAGYGDEPGWQGLDALLVTHTDEPAALARLRAQFERIDGFGRIEIRRGRWPVRQVAFFACRSWAGPAR